MNLAVSDIKQLHIQFMFQNSQRLLWYPILWSLIIPKFCGLKYILLKVLIFQTSERSPSVHLWEPNFYFGVFHITIFISWNKLSELLWHRKWRKKEKTSEKVVFPTDSVIPHSYKSFNWAWADFHPKSLG